MLQSIVNKNFSKEHFGGTADGRARIIRHSKKRSKWPNRGRRFSPALDYLEIRGPHRHAPRTRLQRNSGVSPNIIIYRRGRARLYDPSTGRWLSQDPLFPISGLNPYEAFKNNPLIYTDPLGLDATTYVTIPPHAVIQITDPSSPTGVSYADFGPAPGSGVGLTSPTRGQVNIAPTYDYPILIPTGTYKLTPEQDLALLNRAKDIQFLALIGEYNYSVVPPLAGATSGNAGNNCFGFVSSVCGGSCR